MISGDQASPVGILARACASTRSILRNVTRGQLALPTPCGEWQVHDLIGHIVGATRFFAEVAELGASPAGQEWPDYSAGDFAASFEEYSRRAVAAFSAPDAMDKPMLLPSGPTTGARTIEVATGEIFVHGWDLAKATGQADRADEDVAAALLASPWVSLCEEVRGSDQPPFAPEIRVPPEAPAADRLAAFLGRDPDWPGAGYRFTGLHHAQLAIPPGGEALARRYYGEILGMTELGKPEVLAARGGCWFRGGVLELHLGVEKDFRPAAKAHPGILVENLDELAKRLEASGCDVEWDPHFPGHRRFYSHDLHGNRIELLEPVAGE